MKLFKMFLLIFFVSIQLMAQVSLGLKVSGGLAKPLAPNNFKDNWKTGLNAGAGLTINLLGSFAIEAEADYNRFALDGSKMLSAIGLSNYGLSVSGGNMNLYTVMANAKLYLIPRISPITVYVFGGGGYAMVKFDDIKVSAQGVTQSVPADSQNKLAVQAGVGVQIGIGSFAVFAEGKFVNIFTDEKTNFAAAKAGLMFGL